MKIRIKIFPNCKAPCRMSASAVGFDLFARLEIPVILEFGERTVVPAGFAIEIPIGYEAQIRPRSGLAAKKGITMLNSPGTIDPDYRGEVKVILANFGEVPVTIKNTDRIAQMVICPVVVPELIEVDELSESDRGQNGFGSTGV